MDKSFYSHHVFFCCNQREAGHPRGCCNDKGATRVRDYAKQRVKELKLAGPGQVRINQAGCLDRCELGPCLVVYPEGIWYRYENERDVDEIVEKHLRGGEPVTRLLLPR